MDAEGIFASGELYKGTASRAKISTKTQKINFEEILQGFLPPKKLERTVGDARPYGLCIAVCLVRFWVCAECAAQEVSLCL